MLASVILAAACGGDTNATSTPGAAATADTAAPLPLEIVRGHAVLGPGVRSFQPCGSDDVLGVQDRSGMLRDLHDELTGGGQLHDNLFVVVRGAIGPPATGTAPGAAGEILVVEVRYAVPGGDCRRAFDFRYRATGNEPFWSATVDGDSLTLVRPGETDVRWSNVRRRTAADGSLVFETTADPAARLEVVRRSCRDSMSGAWSALSARLRLGAATLEGCAVAGAAEPDA